MNVNALDQGSEIWWAGSDEWEPWTSAPPVRVIGRLPSDDFQQLLIVETADENAERFLFGTGIGEEALPPSPGISIAAVVFKAPSESDAVGPVNLRELKYCGEVLVCARQHDAPRLSDEDRDRRRKGWAF